MRRAGWRGAGAAVDGAAASVKPAAGSFETGLLFLFFPRSFFLFLRGMRQRQVAFTCGSEVCWEGRHAMDCGGAASCSQGNR